MKDEKTKHIEEYLRRDLLGFSHNETTEDFMEDIRKDISQMIKQKYPYLSVETLKVNQTEKAMNQERRTKGYAFDSLVYRYRIAREALARAEAENDLRYGRTDQRADAYKRHQERADRDLMAFIKILDDVIGEHN